MIHKIVFLDGKGYRPQIHDIPMWTHYFHLQMKRQRRKHWHDSGELLGQVRDKPGVLALNTLLLPVEPVGR